MKPRLLSFLALGLMGVVGIFLVLRATPEGLGLSDDSVGYIAGARSILAGHGYREVWLASDGLVTHFPPAFSSLLALIGLFGLDPLRGARFLNASLFGLNIFLAGILGWRMTRSLPKVQGAGSSSSRLFSLAAGLVLAALFLVNDSLLRVHAVAMSEPLFIFLSLLSFWMLDLYFERDSHWMWLVACGTFVGLAFLTRYAGIALVATFLMVLLVAHTGWRKRLVSAGIFIAGVLPWVAGWGTYNELVAGNTTNRELLFHPITLSNFDTALYNISTFLVPVEPWRRELFKVTGLFLFLIGIILCGLLFWTLRKVQYHLTNQKTQERPEIVAFSNGLYVFGYLAAILASMSFFDASTKFKPRILSPLYVSILILLVLFGIWLWRRRRAALLVLAALIFGMSLYGQFSAVTELMKGGQGYASFQWYDSKTMAYLRTLPSALMIYTNQPGAVYLYTGRGAYVLPDRYDPVTAQPRPGFENGVSQMQADIKAGKAVLALFGGAGLSAPDAAALSNGLYLAQKAAGDEVYTSQP